MIEAVIFDWAGTTVDYGSMAPVEAFRRCFEAYGISVTNEEIRKPMGMLKIDHIRTMLSMPRIYDAFEKQHGRCYEEADVKRIYQIFHDHLLMAIPRYTKLKPYVKEVVKQLRERGIRIGSTTGYTDEMMQDVVRSAQEQGYEPDFWITADSVNGQGRPKPFMIFANMNALHIDDVHHVIKVGDTIADIEEGRHAGVYTVGILEGSSLVGLDEDEFNALAEENRCAVLDKARSAYLQAGADAVISDLRELEGLIRRLNRKQKL